MRAKVERQHGDPGLYAALWNRQREMDAAREALERAEAEEGESLRRSLSAQALAAE